MSDETDVSIFLVFLVSHELDMLDDWIESEGWDLDNDGWVICKSHDEVEALTDVVDSEDELEISGVLCFITDDKLDSKYSGVSYSISCLADPEEDGDLVDLKTAWEFYDEHGPDVMQAVIDEFGGGISVYADKFKDMIVYESARVYAEQYMESMDAAPRSNCSTVQSMLESYVDSDDFLEELFDTIKRNTYGVFKTDGGKVVYSS